MRIVYFILMMCIPILLVGCQTASKMTSMVDTYKILQKKDENQTALLSCSASIACYFARVDDIAVLDEKSKRPMRKAIEQGILRLEGSIFATEHQYALSLIPDRHEVMVWFHPVSEERSEQFHLIHNFKADYQYKLVMYRKRSQGNGSLLQMAAPGELCVDLLQDEIAIRRFCRPYNVMTGQGEFVEKRVSS